MSKIAYNVAMEAQTIGQSIGKQTEKTMNKRQGIKAGASKDLVKPQQERVTSRSNQEKDTGFKDHSVHKGKTSSRSRSPSRGATGGASRGIF